MTNKNRTHGLDIVIGLVLAIIILCGAVGLPKPGGAVATASASFLYEPDRYGTIYLYDTAPTAWEPGDYDAMVAALSDAKALGLDTIVQTFPAALLGSGNESRWLLFLDAAQAVGIDIVAYLWPSTTYTGNPDDPFYYDDLKAFLDVVNATPHPALLGYIGLHEPLEPPKGISADELRAFYTEMKTYAPNLKIAHYLADAAYAEEHRTDGWTFSDGMCDLCMIWYYPFRYIGGDPVYERDLVPPVVQSNVALINERDPDAEVWFLGQSFAQSAHPRNLRMPTAGEMEDLYLLVMQEPVDGFLWYPWNHTEAAADEALGDAGMEDQQTEVGDIANTHTGFASLEVSKSVSPAGATFYLGSTITYTLAFTNYGPHVASSVVITDLVPGELTNPTIVGSSGVVITPTAGTTFAWTVDSLQVGEGAIITLTGLIDPGLEPATVITNTAEITAPIAHDSAALSSTAVITISDLFNDLEISKSVSPAGAAFHLGGTITYTLAFTNHGPHVASSVVITDLVPGELTNPAIVSSSGAVVTPTDGTTFAWTVDSLQVGEGGIITLTGILPSELGTEGPITNTAEISAPVAGSHAMLSSTITIDVLPFRAYLPLMMKGG